MLRSVAVIAAAIHFAQPKLTDEQAQSYALALQEQAKLHDFDPLTGVAIIHFESSFDPTVISKNGEDYGLAQIRARYVGACKEDPDPLNAPGPACREVKRKLLLPEENIRVMAELITANRAFCKKKTGSSLFARWLASYQGRNNARKKKWCNPGEGTYKVIRYRELLLREVNKQQKKKEAWQRSAKSSP